MKTWQKIHTDPSLLSKYLVRETVIDTIRRFFKAQDFHEVETPLLVERPSTETYLEFFETELVMAEGDHYRGFLTTSPEYAMKKILVAGLPKIFQICKSFRNGEGRSSRHNPEFTILEWYRSPAGYEAVMADCEQLLLELWRQTQGKNAPDQQPILRYQGRSFDLTPPWPRISVAEAFARFAGVDTDTLLDRERLADAAASKGYQATADTSWEEMYNQIFLNEIDPAVAKFDQPVILYDYPVSQAALSQRKPEDPRFAERFEFYIGGIELGNAFSELADATEQEARLREDLRTRAKIGKKQYALDEDFITALKMGLPRTGGIAVGVDRLVMLFADVASIHETQFFPVTDVFELG